MQQGRDQVLDILSTSTKHLLIHKPSPDIGKIWNRYHGKKMLVYTDLDHTPFDLLKLTFIFILLNIHRSFYKISDIKVLSRDWFSVEKQTRVEAG
jgi:hypothetical protein